MGISEGCFIFDFAHLADHVHKSGRKTSIILSFHLVINCYIDEPSLNTQRQKEIVLLLFQLNVSLINPC